jgi:hypothetical protein
MLGTSLLFSTDVLRLLGVGIRRDCNVGSFFRLKSACKSHLSLSSSIAEVDTTIEDQHWTKQI